MNDAFLVGRDLLLMFVNPGRIYGYLKCKKEQKVLFPPPVGCCSISAYLVEELPQPLVGLLMG